MRRLALAILVVGLVIPLAGCDPYYSSYSFGYSSYSDPCDDYGYGYGYGGGHHEYKHYGHHGYPRGHGHHHHYCD